MRKSDEKDEKPKDAKTVRNPLAASLVLKVNDHRVHIGDT